MIEASLVLGLVSQGMTLWADYADRAAKGTLTAQDLDAMASHLDLDIEALRAEIAQAKKDGR